MTSTGHSDIETATAFISSLGGPSLDASDIEWINDLEAGRLLLRWISSQVNMTSEHSGSAEEGDDRDRRVHAAMKDSTLEAGEVTILNDERLLGAIAQSQDHPEHQANYMSPSHMEKHADFINREIKNVQGEVAFLRSGISQTKESSKKLNGSIKMIQRAIHDMNTKIRSSEEKLSELSIATDTAIITTMTNSQGLLDDLGPWTRPPEIDGVDEGEKAAKPDDDSTVEESRGLLLESKTNLTALIATLEANAANLDLLRQEELSYVTYLHSEANRMQTAIDKEGSRSTAGSGRNSTEILDVDVTEELANICHTLEQEATRQENGYTSDANVLDILLSELHEGHFSHGQCANDQLGHGTVFQLLRNAWMMDQAAILRLHTETLEKALATLDSVLVPLERLQTALAHVARCIQEAEAILEAFAEELGDISLWSPERKESSSSTVRANNVEMVKQIKEVLNEFKDSRPTATSLPLFTREDIISELHALKARSTRVEASERTWSTDILQEHSRPIHPTLLSQIYANAPLNSSAPFAFPLHVRELEGQMREKAASLQNLAKSVEEEVLNTFSDENNVNRLEAFIEKWGGNHK